MKIFCGRFGLGFSLVLSIVFTCIATQSAMAESKGIVPWEERTKVLNGEILDYVNSKSGSEGGSISLLNTILVVYLGFSEDEIEEVSRKFVDISDYKFLHLSYFDFEYNEIVSKIPEYTVSNTIFVFNLDHSEDPITLEGAKSNNELSEALKSAQKRRRNVVSTAYRFKMGAGGSDKVYVELGAPIEKLAKAEFQFRERMLDGTCSGAIEFVDATETLPQVNLLAAYSSAAPASEEQIDCLNRLTLIFTRPVSVPFREYSGNR